MSRRSERPGDYGAIYRYLGYDAANRDGHLPERLEFHDSSTMVAHTSYAYESDRNAVDSITNRWGDFGGTPSVISKYDYTNDVLGRRTDIDHTGLAFNAPFSPTAATPYLAEVSYNTRNEVTGLDRTNSGSSTPDHTWGYAYDNIGNRDTASENALTDNYYSNELNQYEVWNNGDGSGSQGLEYDADGNLTDANAFLDYNGDGVIDNSDLGVVLAAYGSVCGDANYNPDADVEPIANPDCDVDNADYGEVLARYLTTPNIWQADFTYDAENRLIAYEPAKASGQCKLEYQYDHLDRRIEVARYCFDDQTGEWATTAYSKTRYIWAGWLLVEELEVTGEDPLTLLLSKQYTWGLDLSGTLEDAGGVGGLLATRDIVANPDEDYLYFYDANGNVGQLVATADLVASSTPPMNWEPDAHYEYDPFGGLHFSAGAYADENTFRFSTKQNDPGTDLYYYGYRYYHTGMGRWLNRDPLGEYPDINLYYAFGNAPSTHADALGLTSVFPRTPNEPGKWNWNRSMPDGPRGGITSRGSTSKELYIGADQKNNCRGCEPMPISGGTSHTEGSEQGESESESETETWNDAISEESGGGVGGTIGPPGAQVRVSGGSSETETHERGGSRGTTSGTSSGNSNSTTTSSSMAGSVPPGGCAFVVTYQHHKMTRTIYIPPSWGRGPTPPVAVTDHPPQPQRLTRQEIIPGECQPDGSCKAKRAPNAPRSPAPNTPPFPPVVEPPATPGAVG